MRPKSKGLKSTCLLLALAGATPLAAQNDPAKCAGVSVVLPAELGAWKAPTALTAATNESGLAQASLTVGRAVDARLTPSASVRFIDAPGRAAEVGDHAGLFAFHVARAGTYRVAVGSGAWVDVLEARKPIESVSHGHGPDCSGVVKMVDFPLAAGDHVLQIEGSNDATTRILILPKP